MSHFDEGGPNTIFSRPARGAALLPAANRNYLHSALLREGPRHPLHCGPARPCQQTPAPWRRGRASKPQLAEVGGRLSPLAALPSAKVKSKAPLKRDCVRSTRNRALAYCLRMISAQTHFCVCRDGKLVPTFPDHALANVAPKWDANVGVGPPDQALIDLLDCHMDQFAENEQCWKPFWKALRVCSAGLAS
jgi:hypothetical protein